MNDIEIVTKTLNGDKEQFKALVIKYKLALYRHVQSKVRNIAESEILVNEIFTKAWERLSTYNKQDSFYSWLLAIATNHVIDYVRNKSKIPQVVSQDYTFDGDITTNIMSTDNNIEEDIISTETKNSIQDMVKSLKPEYKKLIHMRYVENMTYDEIAKTLNKPIGTIKTGLYRAKLELGKIMSKNKNLK